VGVVGVAAPGVQVAVEVPAAAAAAGDGQLEKHKAVLAGKVAAGLVVVMVG
jgi:hypothetical protein